MATEMRTLSVARARVHSNSEAKRQSNWTRHLNQSKSIRLREARRRSGRGSTLERTSAKGVSFSERKQQVAATLALESRQALKMLWLNLLQQKQKQQHQHHHRRQPLQQQQQQRQELNGDFGRVSINHVVDYDGQRKRAREAAGDTSGIQNPVISSEKSKSFRRNGRQKHLNSNTISSSSNNNNNINNNNNNNNSDNIDSAREEMAPRGARHRFGLSSSALVVMVAASIVCCANLIGHCNCDTNGNNPFSGFHHSAASAGFETPLTGPPSAAWSSRLVGSLGAARRSGPPAGAPRKSSVEELLRSMAESVERQHLGLSVRSASASSGAAKPSKFDSSSSLDGRRPATNSQALHDDFLKDILASHDRKSQAARKSVGFKPSAHGLPPAVSQADQELRQIMLMHEHAASAGKLQPAQAHQEAAANPIADPTTATRWPSGVKLLSKLPSDLIRKASLAAVVPESVLKIGHRKKVAEAHSNPAFTTTTTGSPFTPRAHTKNYLMGPILNLGQMLMAQPKPASASRKTSKSVGGPAHPSGEQATYSQPANELMTSESNQKPNESQPESDSGFAAADGSQTPPSPAAKGGSPAGDPSGKKPAGGRRNGWLVDGASQLAQTYFKDSFRDLLTLSQLPIFFGGPVSTAPSDIEPGGKKWLANKQAAEQMRGNQTGAVEELLRYLYILTNVGVRRKRDPLKVLGSSHGMQPNALSALANRATGHRRQLMALLADRPTTSLIKFPPPKTELGSKLSSLLKPGKDHIKSRGVMWEMATDPTLAVTMFHLLERASVALPLGFVLMPFVHMIRHPMGGLNFGRILPARASHRSVELEELVKRLDMMDKILSRSMRSTHRDASFMG